MSGNEINEGHLQQEYWEPAGRGLFWWKCPRYNLVEQDTCFDLDDCSISSSVLWSFDSPEQKGGLCHLYFFLTCWKKPSRVLSLMKCLCLDGCDMTSGIWAPGNAPGISSQMSCTMRKSAERKSVLSIWQEKEGAALWVDAQPVSKGVGERGFVFLLTHCPLSAGTKEWARVQLPAVCPQPFLIQKGDTCSVGKKQKHEDGVRTEVRGGRMKDTGGVWVGISPWLQ